jgi:hypothetical protein
VATAIHTGLWPGNSAVAATADAKAERKRGKGGEVSALMASASNKKPRKAPVSRHECLKKGAFVAFDGFWVARRLGRVWFWSGPSPLVLGLNRYGL